MPTNSAAQWDQNQFDPEEREITRVRTRPQGLEGAIEAFRDSETAEERDEAFMWVQEAIGEDDDVADDADLASYAEVILRNRGVW